VSDRPQHSYNAATCPKQGRHTHDYRPAGTSPRRCTCGSRAFTLTAGGPLPVHVACTACARENRVATAYERGREHALAS
jgi:hypothetical protein